MKLTTKQIEEIRGLKKEKKTNLFISVIYGVSAERIRQICKSKENQYCSYHNMTFLDTCRSCNMENRYLKKLNDMPIILFTEIKRLAKPNRKLTYERMLLINRLKYDYNLKVSDIAKLLGRDHSSIIHLIKKYAEQRTRRESIQNSQ